jgi:hypothetical protein
MYRIFCAAAVATWLIAMGILFDPEIRPMWNAQAPPPLLDRPMDPGQKRQSQAGIFDDKGQRVGSAWSILTYYTDQTRYETKINLERVGALPPLRIDTVLIYQKDGEVDEFDLDVYGIKDFDGKPVKVNMRGERYGAYIPTVLEAGPIRRTFKLDAAASRQIVDSVRPFDVLPNLQVGQSWRIQVLDPISIVLQQGAKTSAIVAKVEGRETIDHRGQAVECFVVRAGRARAWVGSEGRVLRQETDIPGFGRLVIRDEEFDQDQYDSFRESFGTAGPRGGPASAPRRPEAAPRGEG